LIDLLIAPSRGLWLHRTIARPTGRANGEAGQLNPGRGAALISIPNLRGSGRTCGYRVTGV
jgi:hypothetical protein